MLLGCICQPDGDLLISKPFVQIIYEQIDDATDVALSQWFKQDCLIQTI